MKTIRLLIVLLLLASSASARHHLSRKDRYAPTVYLVSVHEVDTIYNSGALRQAALENRAAVAEAQQDYLETHRTGFQQDDFPKFVFTSKNNRFSFAVGGFVALRAGYDFDGISDNIDFIPYEIPIPGNYNTEQKLMMDASTSRLYISAIANTRALGRVVVHIDTDFRGGAPGSYTPRLRSAYVNFLGLTFGRDITTFCDLQAAPTTIDFQGPNAYNYDFATLIRYEVSFARRHMTFGIAAEMPRVSGTYGDNFAPMHQRVPDVPAYLQVAWGKDMSSHLRLSGIVRNMYLYNNRTQSTTSLLGWGVQFSGTIRVGRPLQLFMNGVYGEGITPYMLDLIGSGLDFTPDPNDASRIRTTPMWGWQAAAQINLSPRLFLSGGYSMVRIDKNDGFYAEDEYRQGQYIFGNIFYSVTPRFKIAGEYLYGTRENMSGVESHANRVNMLLQYSF